MLHKLIGHPPLLPPTYRAAVGASGHKFPLHNSISVDLGIGKDNCTGLLQLVDDHSFNTNYQCIIGTDLMKLLPDYTVSIRKGTLTMSGVELRLGDPKSSPFHSAPISVIDSVVLEPDTETVITVRADANITLSTSALYLEKAMPK
jgi:hypothetical protein